MTVQATHGQILLDVLTELQALRADLVGAWQSSPPPLFDDESWLPFGNLSQKGEVHIGFMHEDRGSFFFFFVRLYLGASWCIFYFGSWCICFGDDVFFLWVVYVKGRQYVLSFFSCFLFHMWYIGYWFILWGYSWYMSFIFCCVKSRIYFVFTCIFHTCIYVFVEYFRNIQVYSVVLLSTLAIDR